MYVSKVHWKIFSNAKRRTDLYYSLKTLNVCEKKEYIFSLYIVKPV